MTRYWDFEEDVREPEILDEHLVLRDRDAFTAAPLVSEQGFKADPNPVHQSRKLADRGNHSFVDHFRCLLHAIQSPTNQLVGANHLQASAVDHVVDGSIQSL